MREMYVLKHTLWPLTAPGVCLFVFDKVAQPSNFLLQLFRGVRHLRGVVDNPRRQKDDQFGAFLRARFRAERGADIGNSMQPRNASGGVRGGLFDDAANCNRVAILHSYLRADIPLRKRRRVYMAGGG